MAEVLQQEQNLDITKGIDDPAKIDLGSTENLIVKDKIDQKDPGFIKDVLKMQDTSSIKDIVEQNLNTLPFPGQSLDNQMESIKYYYDIILAMAKLDKKPISDINKTDNVIYKKLSDKGFIDIADKCGSALGRIFLQFSADNTTLSTLSNQKMKEYDDTKDYLRWSTSKGIGVNQLQRDAWTKFEDAYRLVNPNRNK